METKIERINRIEKEIKDIKKILEKEKAEEEPKTVKDLKKGDKYYILTANGIIGSQPWDNDVIDNELLKNGNAFLTREEAEAERDYRQSKVIISNWIDDNNARQVEGEDKYFIALIDIELDYDWCDTMFNNGGIYVNSQENAEKIIKEMPAHLTRILAQQI